MVLHTSLAGLNLGTSGGTTWDAVSAANWTPSGDNEVQVRGGGIPRLIGLHSYTGELTQIGATTDYDRFRLQLNTWPAAHYIDWHPHMEPQTVAKYGRTVQEITWMLPGIPLEQDADWTLQVNSTTASMSMIAALYLSYGQMYPYRGGLIVSRMSDFATDGGVYPAFAGAEQITDLDPRFTYRLAGIQLGNTEDQNTVAVRVSSPSNNTSVSALTPAWTSTTFHPETSIKWFPHDSIVVSGTETITIDAATGAATKPTVYTYWEVYGSSGTIGGGLGGSTGGAGGGGMSFGPTVSAGLGGLFGGAMGGIFGGR